MKLYTILETVLKTEPNFVTDEGKLKKWVVISKAQNYDAELIGLLLDEPELKAHFFIPVKDVLVFNQDLFVEFMEQKNYLNDSYTAYKNKIGLTIDGKFLNQRNEVALVWPYKDCVLEGGQSREEDKREEIFFNEVLAQDEINQLLEPKVLTNAKTFTVDGEKAFEGFTRNEEGTITDNLIIKGNNLLALHSLKEEFTGKVKLIYIDPPYNTGSDSFGYNDNFNHSTWLTFMKNRLEVAKELLREDGVIFVQNDSNEFANLKMLMDEVFSPINYIDTIISRATPNARDYGHIGKMHEYIHFYSKNNQFTVTYLLPDLEKKFNYKDDIGEFNIHPLYNSNVNFNINNRKNLYYPFYINPNKTDNYGFFELSLIKGDGLIEVFPPKSVKDNVQFVWRWGKPKSEENLNIEIVGYKTSAGEYRIIQKMRTTEKVARSIWDETEMSNRRGTDDLQKLFKSKVFAYPKSEYLIKRVLEMSTKEGDIVLDYQLGSGTTSAVAHKMKRQYIGVEQMEYIETIAVERLKKVIEGEQGGISKAVSWQVGGSFTYLELKKYNQTFVEKIQEAKDTKTLLTIWEEMKVKSFLSYNIAIQKQDEHIEEFKQIAFEEQQKLLITLLDKNQLYVNLSSLHDNDFECSAEEVKVTEDFYQLKK